MISLLSEAKRVVPFYFRNLDHILICREIGTLSTSQNILKVSEVENDHSSDSLCVDEEQNRRLYTSRGLTKHFPQGQVKQSHERFTKVVRFLW
jgi:hypothetical protein